LKNAPDSQCHALLIHLCEPHQNTIKTPPFYYQKTLFLYQKTSKNTIILSKNLKIPHFPIKKTPFPYQKRLKNTNFPSKMALNAPGSQSHTLLIHFCEPELLRAPFAAVGRLQRGLPGGIVGNDPEIGVK
jgi:hypothetical protein